jgi:hypothetical protein
MSLVGLVVVHYRRHVPGFGALIGRVVQATINDGNDRSIGQRRDWRAHNLSAA